MYIVVSDQNSNPISTRFRTKNDFESYMWIFLLAAKLQSRGVYFFLLSYYVSSGFCFNFFYLEGDSVKKLSQNVNIYGPITHESNIISVKKFREWF